MQRVYSSCTQRDNKSKYAEVLDFVILGLSYPHSEALNEFIDSSGLNISILSKVKNMAEIMSNSDIIGAAGSTGSVVVWGSQLLPFQLRITK